MDFINKKIEEIRKQPENVRMRWVWIMTAISIVIVFLIWVILLKAEKGFEKEQIVPENQKDAIRELNEEKKTIKDMIK